MMSSSTLKTAAACMHEKKNIGSLSSTLENLSTAIGLIPYANL